MEEKQSSLDSKLSKPTPRPPRTPAQAAQIRVRNRRREYLERNPSYFDSADHEFADPLLYDELVRRFQSAAERQAEGKARGYSRVLEGDLLRGEARLAELATASSSTAVSSAAPPSSRAVDSRLNVEHEHQGGQDSDEDDEADKGAVEAPSAQKSDEAAAAAAAARIQRRRRADRIFSGEAEGAAAPETREEGRTRWRAFLGDRFVRGHDEDFAYRLVDEDDDLDVLERRELELQWFDSEEPGWAEEEEEEEKEEEGGKAMGMEKDAAHGGEDGGEQDDGRAKSRPQRRRAGETGIQDF